MWGGSAMLSYMFSYWNRKDHGSNWETQRISHLWVENPGLVVAGRKTQLGTGLQSPADLGLSVSMHAPHGICNIQYLETKTMPSQIKYLIGFQDGKFPYY